MVEEPVTRACSSDGNREVSRSAATLFGLTVGGGRCTNWRSQTLYRHLARRLAGRARRDPPDKPARRRRVRDDPRAPDQDRRARDRARRAYSHSPADQLPGSGFVPNRSTRPAPIRPVNCGASRPDRAAAEADNPKRVVQRVASHRSSRSDRRRALDQQSGKTRHVVHYCG